MESPTFSRTPGKSSLPGKSMMPTPVGRVSPNGTSNLFRAMS